MLAPSRTMLTTERCPLTALTAMVPAWRDLTVRAAEPNVFYEPGFALAAAPVFGRSVDAVLVWSADVPRRLLGLFPLEVVSRRYGVKLPLAVGWTHPFAPLGTPLVDRDARAGVVAAFLDHIASDDALPKRLLLPLLNESGPVAGALRAALAQGGGASVAFGRHRRAVLRPGADRAGYLERAIGGKRRKELRRQRHRLENHGTLSFTVATTPADVAVALGDYLALEAGGWKGRAGTAIAQHPDVGCFVKTAMDRLAADGQARVARLSGGAAPIACAIALTSQDGAWGWKIAYDERFAAGSPGVQVYLDLTKALLADPSVAFADSCATPDHPMIDHLWRERLEMGDWLIALEPDVTFALLCRLEAGRSHILALARRLHDRARG
jgi:CelD/BcsL family acetyltransferase involved in cellulose biosynthesis